MLNPVLDRLTDYPFQRLRDLLDPLASAEGLKVINLTIGEPQHPPPSLITEALVANARDWGRYPPVAPTADLGAAIAAWLTRRYELPAGMVDPSRHIVPTSGTREALYMIAALVTPKAKDNATPLAPMPNPFYQVYAGGALMAGAEPLFLPAGPASGFLPDLDAVDAATWRRASVLYLCSPANPQGAVADAAYVRKAVKLARDHDMVLAMDECYAEIYDHDPPYGALSACAALGDRVDDPRRFRNVLVFHSLSKRSSAPGLRSGFVAGDAGLIAALSRLRNYGGATVPLPVMAASAALWRDEDHVSDSRALYRAKFDAAERILGGRPGFRRPAGGFFLWLDVGDGEVMAKRLWTEAAVRVLPGSYLAKPGADGVNPGAAYVRIALVHDLPTTVEALERMARVLG